MVLNRISLCALKHTFFLLLGIMLNNKNRIIPYVDCVNGSFGFKLIVQRFEVLSPYASQKGLDIATSFHEFFFFLQDLNTIDILMELQGIKFDTIVFTDVFEHLYYPKSHISFCKKELLKNCG